MSTVAGAPAVPGTGPFAQSRSVTAVTVTVPVALGARLPRLSVNRLPLAAVAPHGRPRIEQSTVYEPPLLLRTWNCVPPTLERYAPSSTGAHSDSPPEMSTSTLNARRPSELVRAMFTGTCTHGFAGVTQMTGETGV